VSITAVLCQGKDQRRYQRVIEAEDINDMTFEHGLFTNKEALRKYKLGCATTVESVGNV
jgi:hypothetical protein